MTGICKQLESSFIKRWSNNGTLLQKYFWWIAVLIALLVNWQLTRLMVADEHHHIEDIFNDTEQIITLSPAHNAIRAVRSDNGATPRPTHTHSFLLWYVSTFKGYLFEKSASNSLSHLPSIKTADSYADGNLLTQPSSPSQKYLLYIPYQGISNQLNCLLKGLYLATTLGRTLLIPPIMPSQHDDRANNFTNNDHLTPAPYGDWRQFLNFTLLQQQNPHYKFVFLDGQRPEELAQISRGAAKKCVTYGKWWKWHSLGLPAERFLAHFGVESSWTLHHHKFDGVARAAPKRWALQTYFQQDHFLDDPLLCVANLQHVHFGHGAIDRDLATLQFSNDILRATLMLHQQYLRHSTFIGVHWRRGDFKTACLNKNITSCFPAEDALAERLQKLLNSNGATTETQTSAMSIWIGTNDSEEDKRLLQERLAAKLADHHHQDIAVPVWGDFLPLQSGASAITMNNRHSNHHNNFKESAAVSHKDQAWQTFASFFLDSAMMTFADHFVGNQYSTVTQHIVLRRLALLGPDKKSHTEYW